MDCSICFCGSVNRAVQFSNCAWIGLMHNECDAQFVDQQIALHNLLTEQIYKYSKTSLNRTLLFQKVVRLCKISVTKCRSPRKPNEVRIMGRLFGCVSTQAASKSEHCSNSTLLNRFGLTWRHASKSEHCSDSTPA